MAPWLHARCHLYLPYISRISPLHLPRMAPCLHARCSRLLPVSVVDVASIVPASRSAWSAAPLSALIFFSMDLQRRLG